jgi:hypothetical protein
LPVTLESTGVSDRRLLDALSREYRVAMARIRADRQLCIERLIARPRGKNISNSDDPDLIGRFYDHWCDKVAPTYTFDLEIDGSDARAATQAIRGFLARASS